MAAWLDFLPIATSGLYPTLTSFPDESPDESNSIESDDLSAQADLNLAKAC